MASAEKTLIFDNGAYTIKAGYANSSEYRLLPNYISKAKNERKRIFISDQIKECKDLSSLFFILPFQKGYLINFESERQIWDYAFSKDCLQVDYDNTCLVLTEPHFNFRSIQDTTNEIIFEDYQFKSALRINASTLSAYQYLSEHPAEQCYTIVDVGYSFTHVIPYCRGRKITETIIRNSIGGKALTNHLKEIISYRQLHVMEETYVMNQCKEDVCFVSNQFCEDMETAKNSKILTRDYVLPDFTSLHRGYVKNPNETSKDKPIKSEKAGDSSTTADEQAIRLNHERFTVPEILFHPSDVGFNEMGLSEMIVHSINRCPELLHPHLTNNIVLTGGCCLFNGFADRVRADVRSTISDDYDVTVYLPDDPVGYAWKGGCKLAESSLFEQMVVTREEYNEHGNSICYEKFNV